MEAFECICGDFRKTVPASTSDDALTRFRAYLKLEPERTAGATTVTIRGPVRVKHQTTEYIYDRESGKLVRSRDLRPKKR